MACAKPTDHRSFVILVFFFFMTLSVILRHLLAALVILYLHRHKDKVSDVNTEIPPLQLEPQPQRQLHLQPKPKPLVIRKFYYDSDLKINILLSLNIYYYILHMVYIKSAFFCIFMKLQIFCKP
ncbi:hypothetical protein Pfo_022575 [Paulownia fortunei]|nr:hypothetical protein Pfo_022575 [Paulownia fortunei]